MRGCLYFPFSNFSVDATLKCRFLEIDAAGDRVQGIGKSSRIGSRAVSLETELKPVKFLYARSETPRSLVIGTD